MKESRIEGEETITIDVEAIPTAMMIPMNEVAENNNSNLRRGSARLRKEKEPGRKMTRKEKEL